jgi:site-specific DNA recombinase
MLRDQTRNALVRENGKEFLAFPADWGPHEDTLASGKRLTPTYAIKKGTRYRYYVSSSLVREAKGNGAGGWRLPAGDLEGLVLSRLRNFFADPAALLDAVDNAPNGLGQGQLIKRGYQIAEELSAETPDKAKATLMALLCRVTIDSDRVEIAVCRGRAAELLASQSIDLAAEPQRSVPASHDVMILSVAARLKRVGREMRMLVEGADGQAAADPSLLRIIARAHESIGGDVSYFTLRWLSKNDGVLEGNL